MGLRHILPCPAGLAYSLPLNAKHEAKHMERIVALLLVLVFSTVLARAEDAPPGLLEAIGKQESGMNPLAVNVAGKDHYPATREEAVQIIRQAQATGKSFDVGLYQINSWWMTRHGIPPESLLDPAINRQWSLFILGQEIDRHGLNWKAVGKYHSPDMERGRRYAWKIYRHYAGMTDHKEADNGKAEHGSQKLPDPGGIQRHSGIRPQGRIVTFDIQQTGMPRHSGSEPGASGVPHGTAKD
jgi:soluble lytic murein transglycosylase-like protein